MLSTIQLVLMPLSFALLFFLMLLYWVQAAFFSYTKYKRLSFFVFTLAFLSLTSLLILRWKESGHFPLSNLYESLLFLSWSFLLSQLMLQLSGNAHVLTDKYTWKEPFQYATEKKLAFLENTLKNSKIHVNKSKTTFVESSTSLLEDDIVTHDKNQYESIGAVLSPLALISYTFAFLYLPKEMQKATSLVPALQSNWLMMHVTVMILSYAALIGGSILAMAFLIVKLLAQKQEQDGIKTQTVLGMETVPPQFSHFWDLCERLDNYSYRMLGLGFPLLTVGILSGAVWANSAWGSYWSWDPKETWALITWLVFAIYLHARITKGWNGQKAAIIATFGFFAVWFCYLGVNLLGTGLHSYGWFTL